MFPFACAFAGSERVSKTAEVDFEFITEFPRKPPPIFIQAVANPVFHYLLIYVIVNEQWGIKAMAEMAIGSGFSGWPLPKRKSTVASDETQVMNSNSTSGVQDPRLNIEHGNNGH